MIWVSAIQANAKRPRSISARKQQRLAPEPATTQISYIARVPAVITVPFSQLTLHHHDIGCHRGRRWGFRAVFGFPTLQKLPFIHLANKVKKAYEGKEVPSHTGWPAQREALQWLVERGIEGIYALDAEGVEVKRTPFRTYFLADGNHRALALYILGADKVRAHLKA